MDSLEFGYIFFFFAGVAIGMVLQSKFAVLLFYIVAACGRGQVKVGICI